MNIIMIESRLKLILATLALPIILALECRPQTPRGSLPMIDISYGLLTRWPNLSHQWVGRLGHALVSLAGSIMVSDSSCS